MGRLDIRIVEARNLPDLQWIGKPDPYVVIRIEGQKQKTGACRSTINPSWDQLFKFQVADENSAQLSFEVWNRNPVSDDIMATYTLSISGLLRGEVKDQWYIMKTTYKNWTPEIRIRVCAVDFGFIIPDYLKGPYLAEQGYVECAKLPDPRSRMTQQPAQIAQQQTSPVYPQQPRAAANIDAPQQQRAPAPLQQVPQGVPPQYWQHQPLGTPLQQVLQYPTTPVSAPIEGVVLQRDESVSISTAYPTKG